MNTLSSLPPPSSFAALSLRGTAPAGESTSMLGGLDPTGSSQPLHVSAPATLRSLDDIERDFLAALCENRSA